MYGYLLLAYRIAATKKICNCKDSENEQKKRKKEIIYHCIKKVVLLVGKMLESDYVKKTKIGCFNYTKIIETNSLLTILISIPLL